MNKDIKIRLAQPEDCKIVLNLAQKMATSFEVRGDEFEVSFQEIINESSSTCLVLEKHDEIIGYIIGFDHRAFYANGRVSWVEEIFIEECFRKEGLGRLLMNEFEKWCISRESKLISLATRRASDFYEALNYGESAIYYRKLLNNYNT